MVSHNGDVARGLNVSLLIRPYAIKIFLYIDSDRVRIPVPRACKEKQDFGDGEALFEN